MLSAEICWHEQAAHSQVFEVEPAACQTSRSSSAAARSTEDCTLSSIAGTSANSTPSVISRAASCALPTTEDRRLRKIRSARRVERHGRQTMPVDDVLLKLAAGGLGGTPPGEIREQQHEAQHQVGRREHRIGAEHQGPRFAGGGEAYLAAPDPPMLEQLGQDPSHLGRRLRTGAAGRRSSAAWPRRFPSGGRMPGWSAARGRPDRRSRPAARHA